MRTPIDDVLTTSPNGKEDLRLYFDRWETSDPGEYILNLAKDLERGHKCTAQEIEELQRLADDAYAHVTSDTYRPNETTRLAVRGILNEREGTWCNRFAETARGSLYAVGVFFAAGLLPEEWIPEDVAIGVFLGAAALYVPLAMTLMIKAGNEENASLMDEISNAYHAICVELSL